MAWLFMSALLPRKNVVRLIAFNIEPGTAAATPEPGSIALFAGLGVSGGLLLKRRRK
jgi:hypothetical protein